MPRVDTRKTEYFCDRCGEKLNREPATFWEKTHILPIHKRVPVHFVEETLNRCAYITDPDCLDKLIPKNDTVVIGIQTHYNSQRKDIYLCEKCAILYKKFMKNEL